MAGDWIPIRKDIHKSREVAFIHQRTGVSIPEIVFNLFLMWSWFDSESTDGFVVQISSESCPAIIGQSPEFWQAVIDSGWLIVEENGLRIPNSERYVGKSAKVRLLDAKRKRDERASGKRPENVQKKSEKKRTTEQNRTVKSKEVVNNCTSTLETPSNTHDARAQKDAEPWDDFSEPEPPQDPLVRSIAEVTLQDLDRCGVKMLTRIGECARRLTQLEPHLGRQELAAQVTQFGPWHALDSPGHPVPVAEWIPDKWGPFKANPAGVKANGRETASEKNDRIGRENREWVRQVSNDQPDSYKDPFRLLTPAPKRR